SYEYEAWRSIYREHGVDLSLSDWLPHVGAAYEHFDIYAHLAELSGVPVKRAEMRPRLLALMQKMLEGVQPMPGVEDYLSTAKRLDMRIGIASNSNRDRVLPMLDQIGLTECFDTIVCRDDIGRAKPDPDAYFAAVSNLGVTTDQAIALEDSPTGVKAAKGAGLYCIAVPSPMTKNLSFPNADMRLESLTDVPLPGLLTLLATTR
ncbi:MAG: HAD-IA family hydrolase, partial [Chloroflexi bacterium]|nr:HAD-IA family hydrolase [Chloroflexota bacterium]